MTPRKIITSHVHPPIPAPQFEWCAYHDGDVESNHYGWGATEAEAIADLQRLDQERWECEHGSTHAEHGSEDES